jgi:hypothetical protein
MKKGKSAAFKSRYNAPILDLILKGSKRMPITFISDILYQTNNATIDSTDT